jgi:hypothetical protein
MKIVRIVRYFEYPNIIQQTPESSGIWNDYFFTEEEIDECDYLVILDYPGKAIRTKVSLDNIYHISLEPPNEMSLYRQYANKGVKNIINQKYTGINSRQSHGAIPWHMNKSYDFLKSLNYFDLKKENKIGWITSNQTGTRGHNQRMSFLETIKDIDGVEIYGRGIKEIKDKWEILSRFKYGIAYENFNSKYYWSEKIVDCFLAFSMPIYVGTDNISDYFPEESYIKINPKDINSKSFVKDLLASNIWEKHIDAIIYARELVLTKYQLFPFLVNLFDTSSSNDNTTVSSDKVAVFFEGGDAYFDNYPKIVYFEKKFFKMINRFTKYFNVNVK